MKTKATKSSGAAKTSPSPPRSGGEGRGEVVLGSPETLSLLESCSLIYDAIVREQGQEQQQIYTGDEEVQANALRTDVRELTLRAIRSLLTVELKVAPDKSP